jgi:transcriptional accessory protein Tex/SPT6
MFPTRSRQESPTRSAATHGRFWHPPPFSTAAHVVTVKVLEVDLDRKRVALSMRLSDEPPAVARVQPATPSGRGRQRQRRQPEAAGAMANAFARLRARSDA